MLSSLRPYDYWVEDGQYHFKTPSGAVYVAYFLKLPFADNLYTFNFDRLNLECEFRIVEKPFVSARGKVLLKVSTE